MLAKAMKQAHATFLKGVTDTPEDIAVRLATNGVPFGNVYAAGEIMAGNILRKGYIAGIGMTIGTVFGRIAGESAAQHARR